MALNSTVRVRSFERERVIKLSVVTAKNKGNQMVAFIFKVSAINLTFKLG
ncbi:hypothetical protein JCM30760_24230 [Thiomicrorhabdus hydrogeniphila]